MWHLRILTQEGCGEETSASGEDPADTKGLLAFTEIGYPTALTSQDTIAIVQIDVSEHQEGQSRHPQGTGCGCYRSHGMVSPWSG